MPNREVWFLEQKYTDTCVLHDCDFKRKEKQGKESKESLLLVSLFCIWTVFVLKNYTVRFKMKQNSVFILFE